MAKIFNKTIAIFLSILMLLNAGVVFAAPVSEGENGKTIYLSTTFSSDKKGETTIDSVESGATFYVWINFFNNPTDEEETTQAYSLCIGYDEEKIEIVGKGNQFSSPAFKKDFAEGVVFATFASTDGILDDEEEIASSGPLFRVEAQALTALTSEDLNCFEFLPSATGSKETQETKVLDASREKFTVVQLPDIAVGDINGDIYTSDDADAIKDKLESITFMDRDFSTTTYTSEDDAWDDLEIELPAGGLVEGDNTLVANFNGFECEFDVTAELDAVESIGITVEPDRTEYTAFETFDKSGMVVTAVYKSGKEEDVTDACVVDEKTELKVSDKEWTITYGDVTVKQAITVNPLSIKVPVESDDVLTYTGAKQKFELSTYVEEEYVSIKGETSGKDAGEYKATASLNDKDNTIWDNDTTEDIELSWTIEKAEITDGFTLGAMKYTATYAKLPASADLEGVNNETVTTPISWYTDEDCTVAAVSTDKIATEANVGGTVKLYYKATGIANYEDYKGSVEVAIIDKEAADVKVNKLPEGLKEEGGKIVGEYTKEGYAFAADSFAASKGATDLGNATIVITKDGAQVDKITNVGTYVVTATYEDNDYKGIQEFTVEIAPKAISGKVSLKIGDKTLETTEASPLEVTYTGEDITPEVVAVGDLTAEDYDALVTPANNVKDLYTVEVIGKGNYTGTLNGYWKIIPAEIELATAVVADKAYGVELDKAEVTGVTFNGLKGTDVVEYKVVSAVYADKNAGNVDVTVKVELADTVKNYKLVKDTVTAVGVIAKANAPELAQPAVQTLLASSVVPGEKAYEFNLAEIIKDIPADAGEFTYAVKTAGTYAANAAVEGSKLTFTVVNPQVAGVTDTVVITVSSRNYADADVTVSFEFKNKISVNDKLKFEDITVTYGDSYNVEATYNGQPTGDLTSYSYVGIEGTEYNSNEKPVNAGKYSVIARYEDTVAEGEIPGHVGEITATLTINKKALNDEFKITGLEGTYTYTGEEFVPDVEVEWNNATLVKGTDYEVEYANNVNAGEATVTVTAKDGNYTGTISATFTIAPAAYSGDVTVSANTDVVTLDTVLTVAAPAGDTITYQWMRNGDAITGAVSAEYIITIDDIGKDISVAVTSTGNYAGTLTSTATNVPKLAMTGAVALSNNEGTLTADITDAPDAKYYDIVWYCGDAEFDAANGVTYVITADDKGKEFKVVLVAKEDGIYTGEISSEVLPVPAEAPSFETAIEATAGNGKITVEFKAIPNGAEITSYEIILDGEVIATVAGNENSYVIEKLENGKEYTVKVAAINSVGRTESEEAKATPFKRSSTGSTGGGVSSYRVYVESSKGGKVTTNLNRSASNKEIIITVTPDEGYEVSKVVVTDKDGKEIEVTGKDNEYTFKMPKSIATIDVDFAEIKKEEDPIDKPVDPVDPEDPVEPAVEFEDVKEDAYYYDAVKWAVGKNITTGISEKLFSPEAKCTRAQMVTFLWRAAGSPAVEYSNPFTDVAKDAYYYDAVMWAVKNGITLGISGTEFAPDNEVSRGQTVTFLWRFAGKPAIEADNEFTDVEKDAYYTDAVAWASGTYVTNGVTDSIFAPDAVCVRGQIVTFIYRHFVK